jgi:predicted O-methyltransferase YrrM
MTHDHVFNRIVDEFNEDRIPGWCPLQKALELVATVIALRPKICVEIGVYGGKSLLPIALACESIDNGVVIGIDPWSPVASAEGYTGENATWWGRLDHEGIYASFTANVDRLGLKNRVAIERAKSDDAALPKTIDLCHLDGQHTEQAIRDVRRFGANVRLGGIVCMDDLEWVNDGKPHVAMAVTELVKLGFVELHRTKQSDGCWGFFQRVSLPAPMLAAKRVASKGRKKR